MNLHDLAGRLDRVRFNGDSFMARCPAHPDNTPSLSATIGDSGAIVLKCFAGCEFEAILYALSIDATELFPEDDKPHTNGNGHSKANIVRTYPYTDIEGNLLFEVVRLEPKSFRQRQPDGNGGWVWSLKGVKSKPLYRLPQVEEAANNGEPIYVCEGEKDAERLQVALTSGVATTIAGGAGKWRAEHTQALRDTNVIVIADRDGPGRKHAAEVAAALGPVAVSVTVVEPATGKDVSDHLAAGHTVEELVPAVTETHDYDSDDAPPMTDEDIDSWADPWDIPAVTAYPKPDTHLIVPDDEGTDHTSWWPVDLASLFDGTADIVTPTLFRRDDGQPIIYTGKAHAFNGESESGKSWAALLACVQSVNDGQNVLYIDFEDTAPTVVSRLLALGADPGAVLSRFSYIAPHDPLWVRDKITAGGIELATLLESRSYTVAIIDGVTEAMTLHGLDINSNNDVATFYNILPRRLKQEGMSTIQIDHIPKNRENRSRGGIGGQHKLAGIDVSFLFESTAPFGVGRHGVSKISIEKDRPGQLRQHATGRRVAELHLESDPQTHALSASLKAPEGAPQQSDHWQPTILMELVSDYIRDCNAVGHHPSQNDIEAGVSGKGENIRKAVAELVRSGYVGRGLDGRRNYEHTVITPYTETEEPDAA